jgi:hypothetical protein
VICHCEGALIRAGDLVCVRDDYDCARKHRLRGKYGVVLEHNLINGYSINYVAFDGGSWTWPMFTDELDLVLE